MSQSEIAENDDATGPAKQMMTSLKKLLLVCGLTLFATVIFVVALLVTLPATVITEFVTLPAQVTGLYGSIWRGRANMIGGYTFDWEAQPGALVLGRFSIAVDVQGADTQLNGRLFATPWSVAAQEITGRAGPGLIQLIPTIPIETCNSRAVVDISEVRVWRNAARAEGALAIDAGSCVDLQGRTQTVPEMSVDLLSQGNDALAILTDRDGQLARLTLSGDRRIILRIEPEGATLVPGLPTSGPIILEYGF